MRKMGHFGPKKAQNEKNKKSFFSCHEWGVLNPKFRVESLKNGRNGPKKAPKCQKGLFRAQKGSKRKNKKSFFFLTPTGT